MNAPLLFIHYGNSSYLPYVIKVARQFNPDKEIIFLGDEQNDYLRLLGDISHYPFKDFSTSSELEVFDKLYPRIVNKVYPKEKWADFVLRRWFIINNFIKEKNISQFWTFDSDNFILTDLQLHEAEFSIYDCTSQCKGRCLNGFVPSASIVQNYVNKINEYLSNNAYIDAWQKRYHESPDLFYNEMEAFEDFTRDEGIRNYHLSCICKGSTFEDSISLM